VAAREDKKKDLARVPSYFHLLRTDISLSDTISSPSACICIEATNVQVDLSPLRTNNISFS